MVTVTAPMDDDEREREEFLAQRRADAEEREQARGQFARSAGGAIGQLPVGAAIPAAFIAAFMARRMNTEGQPLSVGFAEWKAARAGQPDPPDVTVAGRELDGPTAAYLAETTLSDGRNARDAFTEQVGTAPSVSVADQVRARLAGTDTPSLGGIVAAPPRGVGDRAPGPSRSSGPEYGG